MDTHLVYSVTITNNGWFSSRGGPLARAGDRGGSGNPGFIDLGGGNYRLTAGSAGSGLGAFP